jgi:hypothetical protein
MSEQQAADPSAKGSLISSCANALKNNAYISLAVMVVLVIIVIGMWVYYHGIFGLGPYASGAPPKGKKSSDGDDEPDSETERLIKSINQK